MSFEETIRTLVRARHPVIWAVTHEEARALRIVEAVANRPRGVDGDPKKAVYVWAASTGIRKVEGGKSGPSVPETESPVDALEHIANDKQPSGAIYVLRDLHRVIDSGVYRVLRDLAATLKTTKKTVVVTSPVAKIPVELEKDIVVVDMPLPNSEELALRLDAAMASWEGDSRIEKLENGARERVLRAGLGLTEDEFESAVLESLVQAHKADPKLVVKAKEQIVRKAGIEFADSSEGMGDVGGLGNLKGWIQVRGMAFSDKAQAFGLRAPRGLFLTGPPGTGKSLTARAAANFLGFPILKVSAESIFGKYVGDSEGNLARILKTAEAVAPSVLYVDEVEKLAAGMRGGGDSDQGVSRRVLGQLLSWMQDHVSPVLLVATANDPLGIPPELMGRFDATFFVDIPSVQEREEILAIQLRKKGRTVEGIGDEGSVGLLLQGLDGFSGREIERVINDGLHAAFADGARLLVVADLLRVAAMTRPLSVSRKVEVNAMRAWAHDNAQPASAPEAEQTEVAARPEV